ncbi:CybS-domain-containing protein [Endogone sp. FLAS-F59071]|nr:CybS-domain-containing protein [Endogone sp. FLAS-F59071]|eukprot:RUS12988.1 CybS-domain-containing protein [Endogone sp. FLAS-F59071]
MALRLASSRVTSLTALRQPTGAILFHAAVAIHATKKTEGSLHWDFERALSIALVPLTAVQLVGGASPATDILLGVVLPLHIHIGMDSVITDYVASRKYPTLNILAVWGMRVATLGVLVGCYSINTSDVGLTEYVARAWKA